MKQDNIALAITMIQGLILQDYEDLTGGEKLTEVVMNKIKNLEDLFQDYATEEQKDFVIRKVFSNLSRTMEDGVVLVDSSTFEPWYKDRKGEIKSIYWDDYRRHLKINEDWPDTLKGPINALDRNTESILEYCADPQKSLTTRKGMVVGNVQSGKTANYLGLICKAADAGYKVIIVIAGMLEDLRRQTQERLEESFVGVNDIKGEKVGIGNFSERDEKYKPICVTDRENDFTKSKTNSDLINITQSAPYVIVVKKNTNTLKHLNTWLNKIRKNYDDDRIPLPLLLIDDEADNASIDIKSRRKKNTTKNQNKKDDPVQNLYPEENPENFNVTAINRNLRLILKKFTTCTYIGYTATPFANIFISPKTFDDVLKQDLFPRDFISYLDPADNYFGPTQSFLTRRYKNFIKKIDIEETLDGTGITIPHKKDFELDEVPESLQNAIKSFIIATTIRWSEGYKNKHSSMLVNASCYSDVQVSIANVINSYKNLVADSLKASAGLDDKKAEKNYRYYREMKNFWESNFSEDKPNISWKDLKPLIHMVANKIDVIVVNRIKGVSERLNYDEYPNGRVVIAVGGYSLSRGLTLKGLISSYYLRTSRMYDTILQMGRWFGYRDDYENICRLYMTENAVEDFKHIAEVINHLNSQIKILETQRKTPREFALYVRSHPDAKRLMITSRPKMGAAEKVRITLTYSGKLISNYLIPKDKLSIKRNTDEGLKFVKKLATNYSENILSSEINENLNSSYAFRKIPFYEIFDITEKHIISSDNVQIDQESFFNYLKERKSELSNWDVIIDSNSYKKPGGMDVGGLNIRPVNRLTRIDEKFLNNTKSITTAVGQNNLIRSNDVENITASKEELDRAKDLIKKCDGKLGLSKAISMVTSRPLLFITIYKLVLDDLKENSPFYKQYKEFLGYSKDIDICCSLSYRLPESGIEEFPKEVYRNADIDRISEDYDDGDD